MQRSYLGGSTQRWWSWLVRLCVCMYNMMIVLRGRGEVINGGFGLLLDGSDVRITHNTHTYTQSLSLSLSIRMQQQEPK